MRSFGSTYTLNKIDIQQKYLNLFKIYNLNLIVMDVHGTTTLKVLFIPYKWHVLHKNLLCSPRK